MQKNGVDLLAGIIQFFEKNPTASSSKRPGRIVPIKQGRKKESNKVTQEEIDRILDKIKISGYNSLNDEEKDVLYKASKD